MKLQGASSFLLGVAGAVVGTIVMQAANVRADGSASTDSVPRVLQYTGTVEFDGVAFTSPGLGMRFTLYDGATAVLSECWVDAVTPGCASATSAVPVSVGRFSVGLGTYTAPSTFERVIAAADSLEIGIEVYDTTAGWVSLAGRQRLTPAAFALWSSTATNLQVSGPDSDGTVGPLNVYSGSEVLAVDGNEIDSNGTLALNSASRGNVSIGGFAEFASGADMAGNLTANQVYGVEGIAGAFIQTVDSDQASFFAGGLTVAGAIWARNSAATARFDGPLDINGAVDIDAPVDIGGNVIVTGSESNGTTGALVVASPLQRLAIDGDEVDSNGPLRLNVTSRQPVVIPTYGSAVEEYNDNVSPEMYELVEAGGTNALPFACVEGARGSMIVVSLADQNQDGLCVCMRADGVFSWWCLNP